MCMLHTSSPKGETEKSISPPTGKKPFLPIVTLSTEVESSNPGGTTWRRLKYNHKNYLMDS